MIIFALPDEFHWAMFSLSKPTSILYFFFFQQSTSLDLLLNWWKWYLRLYNLNLFYFCGYINTNKIIWTHNNEET